MQPIGEDDIDDGGAIYILSNTSGEGCNIATDNDIGNQMVTFSVPMLSYVFKMEGGNG